MGCKGEGDLELLQKLEEQNRALLADAKAVPSLCQRKRNGSISSSVSTESWNDGNKVEIGSQASGRSSGILTVSSVMSWGTGNTTTTLPLAEQWSQIVNNWDQFAKKRSFVSELIRKGLPDEFRPLVWQLFTGAFESVSRKLYDGYLETPSPAEKAIRRDIARTFPKHDLFKDKNGYGQECLFRVIRAYSVHDREVCYCQGSGFIVGMLLMQLPELDAFAMFVQLMNQYRLREMFRPGMVELGLCMFQLERLLADHLPELYTHFLTHAFATSMYASAWFLTLFSTVLPVEMATRVMDLFIVDGIYFIFRMALALLKHSSDKLLSADMESMVAFLQHDGPIQWERNSAAIFESAMSFKLNTKKMKKMEKEYLQIRSQEREDQIELRRLRTENGLLLQRVSRLEEDCSVMADRLVHSQLTRAQESESILALRCELSVLRRTRPPALSHDSQSPRSEQLSTYEEMSGAPEGIESVDGTVAISTEYNNQCVTPVMVDDEEARTMGGGGVSEPILYNFVNGPDRRLSVAQLDLPESPSTTTAAAAAAALIDKSRNLPTEDVDSNTLPPRHGSNSMNQRFPPLGPSPTSSTDESQTSATALAPSHRLSHSGRLTRMVDADERVEMLDWKARYHDLEELKLDQATRSNEQIGVLKDELFAVKQRESDCATQMEDLRSRFAEVDAAWQAHLTNCKQNNESKRTSLRLTGFGQTTNQSSGTRLTDLVLETRYVDQITNLKQQISELTLQRELADRRADRLDQRVTELLESRTLSNTRQRELQLELRQAVQASADNEAKHKADSVWWRSREMELNAQLAERRQSQFQLECTYESLLTSRSLQLGHSVVSDRGDSQHNTPLATSDDEDDIDTDSITGPRTPKLYPPTQNGVSPTCLHTSPSSFTQTRKGQHLSTVWKDLPATVMTESIGPLEELCLVPDDPLITSVYVGSSNNNNGKIRSADAR